MLENVLDNLINRYRPSMVNARAVVQAYAELAIDRLEEIRDNSASDEFLEQRRRLSIPVVNNVARELLTVPATEQWELETVVGSMTAGGGVAFLEANTNDGEPLDPVGRVVRWGQNATVPFFTAGGSGIIFEGGTRLLVVGSGGAAGNLHIQIKIRTHKAASKALGHSAAILRPKPEPDESTHRHVGYFEQGGNSHGPGGDMY